MYRVYYKTRGRRGWTLKYTNRRRDTALHYLARRSERQYRPTRRWKIRYHYNGEDHRLDSETSEYGDGESNDLE